MIISHKYKFIFFAMPKTATHSIRDALRDHMGPGDWEQQRLFGHNALPIPQLAAIGHGHISAQQLKPFIPDKDWNEYFKFVFVRNPYDRFISTYFFLTRDQQIDEKDRNRHMKQTFRHPKYRSMVLVAPQHKLIELSDGRICMDYVARYEDIQNSYDHICRRIGFPSKDLIQKNTSKHRPFNEYYDSELREMVNEFYRVDFESLQYSIVS